MTLQEVKKKAIKILSSKNILESDYDAMMLLFHVFSLDQTSYILKKEEEVSKEMEEKYFSLVEKRSERIPLQHLLQSAPFYGRDFFVNEHVLIPRFDTEVLVYEVLKCEKEKDISVLDLCTGSGIIAITLKKDGGYENVFASDISSDALSVAKKNAEMMDADILFYQSDVFKNLSFKVDVLVSNPPYIETDVIDTLEPEVKDHDPILALDGGKDGLLFYRRIIEESEQILNKNGRIYLEIGDTQGEEVSKLLSAFGFTDVKVIKDLNNKDRVVKGKFTKGEKDV